MSSMRDKIPFRSWNSATFLLGSILTREKKKREKGDYKKEKKENWQEKETDCRIRGAEA